MEESMDVTTFAPTVTVGEVAVATRGRGDAGLRDKGDYYEHSGFAPSVSVQALVAATRGRQNFNDRDKDMWFESSFAPSADAVGSNLA